MSIKSADMGNRAAAAQNSPHNVFADLIGKTCADILRASFSIKDNDVAGKLKVYVSLTHLAKHSSDPAVRIQAESAAKDYLALELADHKPKAQEQVRLIEKGQANNLA